MSLLREHRRAQNECRLTLGEYWHDHQLVFDNGEGRPLSAAGISQTYRYHGERLGFGAHGLRLLRHTHASI